MLLGLLTAMICLGLVGAVSAQADCTGDCRVTGGGAASVDCLAEYVGVGQAKSAHSRMASCQDGDPSCDTDGEVNGVCVLAAQVCLNQADPNLPQCVAQGVDTFRIRNARGDSELLALESQVSAFLPTNEGVCSEPQAITIPLGGTSAYRLPGRKRLRIVAQGANGRDFDSLVLTCTPPPQPLGVRHFSINPVNSPLQAVIGPLPLTPGSFSGYLDLRAGIPDPDTGIAAIDVTGASEYISADLRPLAPMIVCLKPTVPAQGVGVIACKGQLDVSYQASINHVAGVVGENGFTAEQCSAMCGPLGLGCGTVEGPSDPHPGDCNGPLEVGPADLGDSGRGAVAITPDPVTGMGGLSFELSFVEPGHCRDDTSVVCSSNEECGDGGLCMQACGDGPPTVATALPFLSGPVHVEVENADNRIENTAMYNIRGENFSCVHWTQEDGPGKLVFGIPQLHAFSLGPGQPLSDLVTAFVLSDR